MFVIFILSLITSVLYDVKCESCPDDCSCSNDGQKTDCSNRKLTQIPDGIPNTTLNLNLHKNDITELDARVFAGMHNLSILRLDRNNIRAIHNDTFDGIPKLKQLSLTMNGHISLDKGAFRELSQLHRIVLVSTGLDDISGLFGGLENLENLSLRRNKIEYLKNGVFSRLRNLRTLKLHKNKIRYIEAKVFEDTHNLKSLYLVQNKITEIHSQILADLYNIEILDIHDNLLQCNCGILELKEFLFMREIGTNVLCRGPKEHANHALLAIPDFSLCSKQGHYCLIKKMQIIDGHVIASINTESLVQCSFICEFHEQCNAFRLILNETVTCELLQIAHKKQTNNLDVSNDIFEAC